MPGQSDVAIALTTKPRTTRAADDRAEALPGPDLRDERDRDDAVERRAGLSRVPQEVEHDRDDHAPEHRPRQASAAAEDESRVHDDEELHLEVERVHAELERREHAPGQPCDGGAARERHELQAVDGDGHDLGRERVVVDRPPCAPGARSLEEVEGGDDDRQHRQEEVEVRRRAAEAHAEEVERGDAGDAVRPAGQVDAEPVDVERELQEDLAEEQRHDREVVAAQPS